MKLTKRDREGIIYSMGDALDRIGVTVMALSVMGGWFSEAFTATKALIGMTIGLISLVAGVSAKLWIDKEKRETGS